MARLLFGGSGFGAGWPGTVLGLAATLAVTQAATTATAKAQTPGAATAETSAPAVTLLGGIEVYHQRQWPRSNTGTTPLRGFDNRSETFTIQAVTLGVAATQGGFSGRLVLQYGHTPATYYAAEPTRSGGAGVNASDAALWQPVREAQVAYAFASVPLEVAAGVFLSPIGPEGIAVRDHWNWSRSNLFFGLPFYHTGVRFGVPVSARSNLRLGLWNGWNSVVDGNDQPSVSAQWLWSVPGRFDLSVLYFGGVERPTRAGERGPEGTPWRHLFDTHFTWQATESLSVLAHLNAGFEDGDRGRSRWWAGALYARQALAETWAVALRGDVFDERVPADGQGRASSLFWPVAPGSGAASARVASGTLTLEHRPVEALTVRLELRHDRAWGLDAAAWSGEASGAEDHTRTTATLGVAAGF